MCRFSLFAQVLCTKCLSSVLFDGPVSEKIGILPLATYDVITFSDIAYAVVGMSVDNGDTESNEPDRERSLNS